MTNMIGPGRIVRLHDPNPTRSLLKKSHGSAFGEFNGMPRDQADLSIGPSVREWGADALNGHH
ncbi:MAG: hypothetical protein JW395_3732 [Nitrospira sp.]|nr:hypothetical protein [Nitrospira sp.]